MKILTVTNRKGGVGKTSQSRTLAEYFSVVKKLRVLAIDLDSQCSLSHLFMEMDMTLVGGQGGRPPVHPEYKPDDPDNDGWNGRSGSADIYYDGVVIPYKAQRPEGADTLDILPGNKEQLSHVEEQDQPSLVRKVENRLREFLSLDDVRTMYDLVIIDTGPGESPLARSALRACTHVLIPIEVEPQCIRGLYEMIGEIKKEDMNRTLETQVQIVGIQPTKYKVARTLHKSLLQTVKTTFKDKVSPVIIPDLAAFAERDADLAVPRSLFHLPPSHRARQVGTEFCEFVDFKLFGEQAHEKIA